MTVFSPYNPKRYILVPSKHLGSPWTMNTTIFMNFDRGPLAQINQYYTLVVCLIPRNRE